MTGLGANMIGEKITPLRVHFEVGISIAGRSHNALKLASSTKAQPARQQSTFSIISRFALARLLFVTQLFDPLRDRIIVAVGDKFTHASDICHKSFSLTTEILRSHVAIKTECSIPR
jgi:hypothetical protein